MDEPDHIEAAAQKHGVPALILRSLAHVESRNDPMAVSPAGAVGEFQIMPRTAVELGYKPSDMFDRTMAADAAAKYVRKLYDRFKSWDTAVQAYNAGPARVAYRLRQGLALPGETINHLARVKAAQAAAALANRSEVE